MFILYLIILFLLLLGMNVHRRGIYEGYISKEQCNCIKGFFIVIVFCRHIWPYLAKVGYDFTRFGDEIFRIIDANMGQLLVVMFLFYSGYGVMEQIKRRGTVYVSEIPIKRLLPTIANFDVAILLFLAVDILFCHDYTMQDVLLAFTGWTSIGNSNWYIFVILCCYFSTYLTYILFQQKIISRLQFGGGNLLIIILIHAILLCVKQLYWYDTIYTYLLGAFYSLYKHEIECVLIKRYRISLGLILVFFVLFSNLQLNLKGMVANMRAICFALLIVLLSMKVQINSKALEWLGKRLFPLYIYQRIGMIVLSEVGEEKFIEDYPYGYIFSCAMITLFFGWAYKFIQIKIK